MNNTQKLHQQQKEILKSFIGITGKKFKDFEDFECFISDGADITQIIHESTSSITEWLPIIQEGIMELSKSCINVGITKAAKDAVIALNEVTMLFANILKYKDSISALCDEFTTLRCMEKNLFKTEESDNELD